MTETVSELRGVLLVSREEGAVLGNIDAIHVDPETRALVALAYRNRKGPKKERYLPMGAVEKIGRDVILVTTESAAKNPDVDGPVPGRSLRSLQGCWVTTRAGRHLGTLVDMDFSPSDFRISELELAEGKQLSVDPSDLRIGDEIIVPSEYEDRVRALPEEKYGVMGRLLGGERIDDLRTTIKRVLGSAKREDGEG